MSYEIIKSITFDEKNKSIRICSSSNNITPKTYEPWYPCEHGADYDNWKRMFAGSLFDGTAKFQPSCKSRAKKAYDRTNRYCGLRARGGVWWEVEQTYPYDKGWVNGKHLIDEDLKAQYDKFREFWISEFLKRLDGFTQKAHALDVQLALTEVV